MHHMVTPKDSVTTLLARNSEYVIEKGIPRHKKLYTSSQAQTSDAFGFKWLKRDTYESEAVQNATHLWLTERYSLLNLSVMDLVSNKVILDAGCGAGHSSLLLFGEMLHHCRYIGMDISNAVDVAAQRFADRGIPGEFIQASLLDIPVELGNFDVIFSEGVLHHCDSTEEAIRYLAGRLNPDGIFMFYIYRKKGPIREFTDDYIRSQLAGYSDQEAWEMLWPLTKLGKTLGDLDIEIDIDESIGVLNIPSGKINLQRLFYWHVFKAFHRPDWTLDEMNHVNFDWYRPQNCHRQTPQEVSNWLVDCDLRVLKMDVQEAGITVIAQKV